MQSELDKINAEALVPELTKEDLWLIERAKQYITASVCPKLMPVKMGWGDTVKRILYGAKYQHRTGMLLEQKDFYQFKWGKEHEPTAIKWLKANCTEEINSCTTDFEEIVFNVPFRGFGDSPDFYADGGRIVGEIKCPVDQIKIEIWQDGEAMHDKLEDYWQCLGHFVGKPDAEELWILKYDAYAEDGHIVKMYRKDHVANIEKLTTRIKDAIYVVDQCLTNGRKIGDVETILNEREVETKELTGSDQKYIATQKDNMLKADANPGFVSEITEDLHK